MLLKSLFNLPGKPQIFRLLNLAGVSSCKEGNDRLEIGPPMIWPRQPVLLGYPHQKDMRLPVDAEPRANAVDRLSPASRPCAPRGFARNDGDRHVFDCSQRAVLGNI